MTLILGIESSCDETAAAVVENGTKVLGASLATSSDMHVKTGGIIPEVAARKQAESIIPVVEDCLLGSGIQPAELDAVAVTVGPGLIGSLVVGVEAAKALALAWNKPLIPVNHLVAHLYANFINRDRSEIQFPSVVLIVSGGHTDLVLMKNHGSFDYIGGTLDDAAGEAFDKVARLLGLSAYLGGPKISQAAKSWDPAKSSYKFKRPMHDSKDYNFSFSGIKTAVFAKVESLKREGLEVNVNELAFEFQEAVTDVLVQKTVKAAQEYGAKTVMLAGGVSANTVLRAKLAQACVLASVPLLVPPLELCTDNAVSIASCAHFNFKPKPFSKITADPSLGVMD